MQVQYIAGQYDQGQYNQEMKIGIIGSGQVGGTLGKRWAQNGHTVVFGTRGGRSEAVQALLAAAGPNACSASLGDTVRVSDVLLLATPWDSTVQALSGLAAEGADFSGKILLDATNPLLPGLAGLAMGTTTSGAELVAEKARGALVVKAFNSCGFNVMANPAFPQGSAVMFYCGDDAEAKSAAAALIAELGFEAVDAGPLAQARLLEPLAMLWISLAVKQGFGREIGLQFLRR